MVWCWFILLKNKEHVWKHCSMRIQHPSIDPQLYPSPRTRGTFRQVPTRRIRLSFVECAYSDLRDIFFIILRFKMDSAIEKDGTQLENNNFGTYVHVWIIMSSRVFSVSVLLPFLLFVGRIYTNHTYVSSFLKFGHITGRIFTTSESLFMSTDGVFGSRSAVTSYLDVVFDRPFGQ